MIEDVNIDISTDVLKNLV